MRRPQYRSRLDFSEESVPTGTTGRFMISFSEGGADEGARLLRTYGLRVAYSNESSRGALAADELENVDVLIFPDLELALLSGDGGQEDLVRSLTINNNQGSPIRGLEPERALRLLGENDLSLVEPESLELGDLSEEKFTWALQASRVISSPFSGEGIRIAILDGGLDLSHPDFKGRWAEGRNHSFVQDEPSVQDQRGHGTHCAGIACGPLMPAAFPRYGVAHKAEIFIGKVVDRFEDGAEGDLAHGIQWALQHKCAVILMALQGEVSVGEQPHAGFEKLGQAALKQGSLLIAAVGNHSRRPTFVRPVAAPANCPSIFGVGAIAPGPQMYRKSNAKFSFEGAGEVNLVGPGVRMYSSFVGGAYERLDGTSMAAALVAGIATLYAQSDSSLRGVRLGMMLAHTARDLGLPPEDQGAGQILAPV